MQVLLDMIKVGAYILVFPPIPGIFGEPQPKSGAGIPGTEGRDRGA